MNAATQNFADIDDLLDGTLDDLADMPEFKPFTAGAYKMKLNFEQKKINDITAIELKLTIIEPVEVAEGVPSAPGDTTNVLYMLKRKDESGKLVANELAQGQFKALMTSLAPAFPEAASNRAIMEAAEGYEVLGVTSVRPNKKDKTSAGYTSLDTVALLD